MTIEEQREAMTAVRSAACPEALKDDLAAVEDPRLRTAPLGHDRDNNLFWKLHAAAVLTGLVQRGCQSFLSKCSIEANAGWHYVVAHISWSACSVVDLVISIALVVKKGLYKTIMQCSNDCSDLISSRILQAAREACWLQGHGTQSTQTTGGLTRILHHSSLPWMSVAALKVSFWPA